MNNVQQVSACQGVFYIFENFFKKFGEFSTLYLSPIGIWGEREIISLCPIWIRKEVNSYGAIFFREKADSQASV